MFSRTGFDGVQGLCCQQIRPKRFAVVGNQSDSTTDKAGMIGDMKEGWRGVKQ